LERFGSVAAIRKATREEIAATPGIGSKIAEVICNYLDRIGRQTVNVQTGEITRE
jgi:excinuclease ABC subunit C